MSAATAKLPRSALKPRAVQSQVKLLAAAIREGKSVAEMTEQVSAKGLEAEVGGRDARTTPRSLPVVSKREPR